MCTKNRSPQSLIEIIYLIVYHIVILEILGSKFTEDVKMIDGCSNLIIDFVHNLYPSHYTICFYEFVYFIFSVLCSQDDQNV